MGEIQLELLDHNCRIGFRHIELSEKSPCLWGVGYKAEHYARVARHDHSVGEIKFVEVGGYRRQWTYKAVLQQSDVVAVDVDFAKHVLEHFAHVFLIGHYVVEAFMV